MRKLTSTQADAALTLVFTMAEGDSFSSFSETDTESVLLGSAYYTTEDSDASSIASLSLPVTEIWPYLFEPERSTSCSESEEMLEVDSHPREDRLGNTNWYVNNT